MRLITVSPDELVLSPEMTRTGSAKQFEDRLKASIEAIGVAEPLKVAKLPTGRFLVIDGAMRVRAIEALRETDRSRFTSVPAYLFDYERRYELRFQSDIYQDLLPSQLAQLVEHLHATENVRKVDIARYIGVSPATLRNYTGLWRLIQRGGLFAAIVTLMDVEVIPSSNPYAWLRLTSKGLRKVLLDKFTGGEEPSLWIERQFAEAQQGNPQRFPIKFVEAATDALPPDCYREGEEVRLVKQDLGQRRGRSGQKSKSSTDQAHAIRNLNRVARRSGDPLLVTVANSLKDYLQ